MKKITGVFLTLMLTLTAMCAVFASNAEASTLSTSSDSPLYLKIGFSRWDEQSKVEDAHNIYKVALVKITEESPIGENAVDISDEKDRGIMAWWESYNEEENKLVLYIGTTGDTIKAGSSLAYAFYGMSYVEEISGLELLDTTDVTDMSGMFSDFGWYSTGLTLDLGDNFDTSKVTNMSEMFSGCGCECAGFTLDLGENFNTSKVTDMSYMFFSCGASSEVFTLDLGDEFNTSNVLNMSYMFSSCGASSEVFTLDLGENFDTSKVTDMSNMFDACGKGCGVFTLDLGDNFNTSKVTNMSFMFNSCGTDSGVFELNLGDKFDTANVMDMSYMFASCGEKSTKFTTLDISGFTVREDAYIRYFAIWIPATTFIFGDGWAEATMPGESKDSPSLSYNFANAPKGTETILIDAPDNVKEYPWHEDGRIIMVKTIWTSETDAGYYMYEDAKLGVIRFLFDIETDGKITETGIKYINARYIFENMNFDYVWFAGESDKGEARAFYGDITGIDEDKADNTYYAVAYVVINGETYWSEPVSCQPDFNKYVDYNAGGVQ